HRREALLAERAPRGGPIAVSAARRRKVIVARLSQQKGGVMPADPRAARSPTLPGSALADLFPALPAATRLVGPAWRVAPPPDCPAPPPPAPAGPGRWRRRGRWRRSSDRRSPPIHSAASWFGPRHTCRAGRGGGRRGPPPLRWGPPPAVPCRCASWEGSRTPGPNSTDPRSARQE